MRDSNHEELWGRDRCAAHDLGMRQWHRNHCTGSNHHCVCLAHDRSHNNSDTNDDWYADHDYNCGSRNNGFDNNGFHYNGTSGDYASHHHWGKR